ncbi:DhaK domain,DhaL domain [Cinara cedri]|uniref:Triokinase/FMN cyclase n=2 Tax=Cinara cedri TaxID=506608 RepID=A0A5E4M491_9HEMI|nr:DhaK domain,DhaL domain [Cinara cedri]
MTEDKSKTDEKYLLKNGRVLLTEMFEGLAYSYKAFDVYPDSRIVGLKFKSEKRVCLLGGGGSGHEPYPFGYIGEGMLSASVSGYVFTCCSSLNIYQAIKYLNKYNGNSGILIIVANYTGDVFNFGLACEKAKKLDNIKVAELVVSDDCSRPGGKVGKRGMCGLLYVIKILGALAKRGNSIDNLLSVGKNINDKLASLGISATSCNVPGKDPSFVLQQGEFEFGVGLHGEAGTSRIKACDVKDLIRLAVDKIIKTLCLKESSIICLIVNNLGLVSCIELGALAKYTKEYFDELKIEVSRMFVGTFIVSLNMYGFQLSAIDVSDNPEWINYIDEETSAFAWPGNRLNIEPIVKEENPENIKISNLDDINPNLGVCISEHSILVFKNILKKIGEVILQNVDILNKLDLEIGDGDNGSTISRFGSELLATLNILPLSHPASVLYSLALICEDKMGGASGALYSLLLTGAASHLVSVDYLDWTGALQNALKTAMTYSSARKGDKTMFDPIIAIHEVFQEYGDLRTIIDSKEYTLLLDKTCKVLQLVNDNVKQMKAEFGKASYVESVASVGKMDAGAYGVVLWFNAIYTAYVDATK